MQLSDMGELFTLGTVRLVGVYEVCGTAYAFAALKHDGTVLTWGHPVAWQAKLTDQFPLLHFWNVRREDVVRPCKTFPVWPFLQVARSSFALAICG